MEHSSLSAQITISKQRQFMPEQFEVTSWEQIQPFYEDLLSREIGSKEELLKWFKDRSELEAILAEDLAWRYIRMTCDTTDEALTRSYQFFVKEIEPKVAPYSNSLNKKALESEFLDEIDEEGFDIIIRSLRKELRIFREENIPIKTEIQTTSKQYGAISGAMTVTLGENEVTLQQAAVKLQDQDRNLRESVYNKIATRRLQDRDKLDDLFNRLVSLRHQLATNADFDNFRDYMFTALGRFDYGPEDCFRFHDAVSKSVVPIADRLAEERREKLALDQLRPWDKAVDLYGKAPLRPFQNAKELIDNGILLFERIDPFLGECLNVMQKMGHLDLESRKGKAPGGYNYPLAETGVPFIFMNATSTLRDLVTLMHEGGHAIHSFLTRELPINELKHTPSEVAELASMSMELISMDHWDIFFKDEEDLIRAKKGHLEQILEILPWIATIDKFQHWIYENPQHTSADRLSAWNRIYGEFSDDVTDWSGLELNRDYLWQKQLHLYEVPFYYIEYGMAQLGAIAVWRNYKEDAAKGLEGYINALKLGYMRTIPEIYQAANVSFDFSEGYIRDLMNFVSSELNKL